MIEFRSYDPDPAGMADSVTMQTDAVTLEDLVPVFERFLLAVGYVMPRGYHLGYEIDEPNGDDVDNPNGGDVDNEVTIDHVESTTPGADCGGFSQVRGDHGSTTEVTPEDVVEVLRWVAVHPTGNNAVLADAVRLMSKAVLDKETGDEYWAAQDIARAVEETT